MEEKKPNVQYSRTSDAEKDLFKALFKDNEVLLLALRNLLFGFELDENEKAILSPLLNSPEAKKLMRKTFLPELEKDIPIGQSVDLWMTIKLDDPARDKSNIKARELLIERIETALRTLEDFECRVDLTPSKVTEELMNRNTFISHVEQQLMAIRALANEKSETEEERAVKLAKDSLK